MVISIFFLLVKLAGAFVLFLLALFVLMCVLVFIGFCVKDFLTEFREDYKKSPILIPLLYATWGVMVVWMLYGFLAQWGIL